jgi:cytochrome c biogenesis factor
VGADGTTIDLKLEYHPLIVWLWVGGGIMSLGAIVVLWSLRRRPRRAPLDTAGAPALPDAPTADG